MAQKWLGKDIFYHSGMQQRVKDNPQNPPECFVMLNDQFRMEKEIADVANMYYGEYGGLKSHDLSQSRIEMREQFYSWYAGNRTDHCIQLIDIGPLHSWATGVRIFDSSSRLNFVSAIIDVDIAFRCLQTKIADYSKEKNSDEKALVLIVVPYKAQLRIINSLIENEYKRYGFTNLGFIKAGTIHSFQGNEADIVILDLVADEPHWNANLFIPDNKADEKNDNYKMFNVGITRAKFQLFVVGNLKYIQKTASQNALSQLMDYLLKEKQLPIFSMDRIYAKIGFSPACNLQDIHENVSSHIICNAQTYKEYLIKDIQNTMDRIIIFTPDIEKEYLELLLPHFTKLISLGKSIIVITSPIYERKKKEIQAYNEIEKLLLSIGVTIIHKIRMYEKMVFIDSDILWIGSNSPLDGSPPKGFIIHRFDSHSLLDECISILHIKKLLERIVINQGLHCPNCGQEMSYCLCNSGKIYEKCEKEGTVNWII